MTPKTSRPRLTMPARPPREYATEYTHARIPAELKAEMLKKAFANGETETDFLIAAIRHYVKPSQVKELVEALEAAVDSMVNQKPLGTRENVLKQARAILDKVKEYNHEHQL